MEIVSSALKFLLDNEDQFDPQNPDHEEFMKDSISGYADRIQRSYDLMEMTRELQDSSTSGAPGGDGQSEKKIIFLSKRETYTYNALFEAIVGYVEKLYEPVVVVAPTGQSESLSRRGSSVEQPLVSTQATRVNSSSYLGRDRAERERERERGKERVTRGNTKDALVKEIQERSSAAIASSQRMTSGGSAGGTTSTQPAPPSSPQAVAQIPVRVSFEKVLDFQPAPDNTGFEFLYQPKLIVRPSSPFAFLYQPPSLVVQIAFRACPVHQ